MRRLFLAVTAVVVIVIPLLYFAGRSGKVPEQRKALSVTEVLGGTAAHGFARAIEPHRFAFPEDHGPHPGFRNEWWYFTGNLKSSQGRRFGYQLTFFRVALTPQPAARSSAWGSNEVFMAHFAVTDVEGKRFRYAERFSRAALGLAGAGGRPVAIRLEDWSAQESSARPWSVKLTAVDADMAIELDLRSLKREILNGEAGLSRKSGTPGNASYYYSLPRMETSGTIRAGKESFRVTGLSWLDREWSTSALERDQVGWDWFALQLDDGRDIMFYRLRRRDGSSDPFSSGTLVAADGSSRHLGRDEVQMEITRWWTSPATGARYPSVWRMRIPSQGIDLEITPRLAAQELVTGFRYWEGAVALQGLAGTAGGSGYLEMTGY
ncbi:MAG: hydrolase [Geobacteraceae bacterium GWC2_58_44]|nr:MAG: hydrolase [Geobacteraceae bacterium GWC2_58_44]HBG06486.1 carotenoid 1,2-hydratase [Geobacter sp.]